MTRKNTSSAPDADAKRSGASRSQIGEGSYEGTRNYQKSINKYLEDADVASDARAAQPADEAEAQQLAQAEREGKSHSKARGS
jgi:hypothetical protein